MKFMCIYIYILYIYRTTYKSSLLMVKSSFLVAKMPRTCPSRCPVARMKPRVGHGRGTKMDPGWHDSMRQRGAPPWNGECPLISWHGLWWDPSFWWCCWWVFQLKWGGEEQLFQNRGDSLMRFVVKQVTGFGHFWLVSKYRILLSYPNGSVHF